MNIKIGTFNLNNLFSRWNFLGEIEEYKKNEPPKVTFKNGYLVRKYYGKVVKGKKPDDTVRLAKRIKNMKVDILAVQEVENKDILKDFNNNENYLNKYFKYCILIEGNDNRLIDVGLMSKYPIGEIRSYQKWIHPKNRNEPIFRRDLLQVEILSKDLTHLFWVFVVHLKSKLSLEKDPIKKQEEIKKSAITRKLEAESIRDIINTRINNNDLYFLCGDFNDIEESDALTPIFHKDENGLNLENLINKYVNNKNDRWTTTFDEPKTPRVFEQIDFILTPKTDVVKKMSILRRETSNTKKDGSDHDPIYCEIEL